jgi:agmatine deiminase
MPDALPESPEARGAPPATPRERGFRWPAEWERHEATLMAWPQDPTTWPDCLAEAEAAFATLAAAISQGETVHLLVPDERVAHRAAPLLEKAGARDLAFHGIATADAWLRDTGPIVVTRGDEARRERLALDFRFNAWGVKYPELLADDELPHRLEPLLKFPRERQDMVLEGGSVDGNGHGLVMTTEQCLLNPNRNPDLSREQIEARLRDALGARGVLWLGAGIEGDDTDGHVDDIARFVGPRTVVTVVPEDPRDPDHAALRENEARLRAWRDGAGQGLEVIALPAPEPVLSGAGERLPASYANFYIANAAVCVPVFGQRRDDEVLRILTKCFPGREVVPVPCARVVEGFGSLHCVTQQVPA